MRDLKTSWKVIGRSGKTIDGREVSATDLKVMAETYDPVKKHAALIWPEHERFFGNLGKVEQLKFNQTADGGELLAILAPNNDYLYLNRNDQHLFTSMEITTDYCGTGLPYLSGLAATDQPAVAGTSEIRFSVNNPGKVKTGFIAFEDHQAPNPNTQTEDAPGWFKRWYFNIPTNQPQDETPMTPDQLSAITAPLNKLVEQFAQAPKADPAKPEASQADPVEARFKSLEEKLDKVLAKFSEEAPAKKDEPAPADAPADEVKADYAALQKQLADLTESFNRAVKAKDGTKTGEHTGETEDFSAYL